MRVPLIKRLDDLRSNFWFAPLTLAASGGLLAVVVGSLDRQGWPEILSGAVETAGASGARVILSTIAASAITVAGVIFSVTLVSLSLAATQLGPRLIRNYLQRGGTQIVMGILLGTFVYCMLALRGVPEGAFAKSHEPRLAVLVGLALGFASFLALIAFVHHMVHFIQAPNVLAAVGEELHASICRTFPEPTDSADREAEPLWQEDEQAQPVLAQASGYVQVVNYAWMKEHLAEHGGRVRMRVRPGDYIAGGQPAAMVVGARDPEKVANQLAQGITIGRTRSAAQDPGFVMSQFVEVAVRALSPGTNDPFTACAAVDRVGEGLRLAMVRDLPPQIVRDDGGEPRVWTSALSATEFVDGALDLLRRHGVRDLSVTLRLLETVGAVLSTAPRHRDFTQALRRQGQLLGEAGGKEDLISADRERLEAALAKIDASAEGHEPPSQSDAAV